MSAPLKTASRDKLLDAAEELFARRGFGGVGLAEVAERAGLGKASLFHHFPSKAQLYCAVMARVLTRLDDALVRALAEGGSPTARLDRWVDTAIDVLAANRSYPRLLVRVLVEDDELPRGLPEGKQAADAVRRIGTTAVRLLHEGMDAGELRRSSAGHVLQSLIGSIVHPLATGRFGEELVGGSLFDPEQLARRKQVVKGLLHEGVVVHSTDKEEVLA
ncbi:MAG: TetR/AcrR family transcriptional regulator [Acidimicrobiia bacterium]